MNHPERLGKYPITGVLGQGAMGVVYMAHDPVIDRPVAIKTIQRSLLGDDASGQDMAARFRNEAKAVGRLVHPGIVSIYEYGEDTDTAYIAMEYVEGRSLDHVLRANPMLPESEVLSIMEQLLDALDTAHRHGVWHRDIKPANLLLTPTGQVKLTDFGVARIANMALTRVAAAIGTPGYMAPEQYMRDDINHKVDVFAAGVLLYRLLAGCAPFTGNAEQVMYKVLNVEPTPPSQVPGSTCPAFYDALVRRALAKKPEERMESAADFRKALKDRGVDSTPSCIVLMSPLDDATVLARPAASQTDWTSGPNATALAQVEKELATVMGPIAKAIVRKAARTCNDVDSLRRAVSEHIPGDAERAQFVSHISAASKTGTGASSSAVRSATAPPSVTSMASGTGANDKLSDEAVATAVQRMTDVVGVIGRVMVKRAAAKTTSKAQFVALLVEGVDAGDQERVRAALRSL
jgi:serine/threonine-protein kinase